MPYVSSSLWTGDKLQSATIVNGVNAGKYSRASSATGLKTTYSFRTGRGLTKQDAGQPTKLDPNSEVYRLPSGSIADRLAYRKRFIETQMTLIDTRAGAPTHFLLGDMGHEFGTFRNKVDFTDNSVRVVNAGGTTVDYSNIVPTQWPVLNAAGSVVLTSPLVDLFSNYFVGKGFPYYTPASSPGPSMANVRTDATQHISELNPFKTKASVLTSLLELARGDVPNILKSLRSHMTLISRMKASGIKDASKALGSEYLNNVFGWSPIIRDVAAAFEVLLTLDQMLFPEDDTRRRVQRVISQRGNLLTGNVALTAMAPLSAGGTMVLRPGYHNWLETTFPSFGGGVVPGTFPGTYSVSETYSLWTTARFNTAARPSATNNGNLDRMIELLGLELTPEVLWELTPWTWLIDWFGNIGTVIGNLSTLGLSNTILNYAYSTARVETLSSIWCRPTIVSSGTGVRSSTGNFLGTMIRDGKVRIAASPFGFGFTLGSLSSGQWAILAALGLSRGR